MAAPIAIVDTGALLLLLETPSANDDPERARRRAANELAFAEYQKLGPRFVVPTPVIAELCREGSGLDLVRDKVTKLLSRVRTESLDTQAADLAGQIRRVTLAQRAQGQERGAVSYDALIAGIAHRVGAKWLLTTNPDDMRRCLVVISSPVEVVDTTAIPEAGQLHQIAHQQPK